MRFNPLDHPLSFAYPTRTAATSAWTAHVPLALLLVDLLRPAVFVELGTHSGVSYCAFCQAVKDLGLDTRCYAVDTWEGDSQTGFYGPEVLSDLKAHHDPRYAAFSHLLHCRFDEALPTFADGSIDLLHLDGYHTYEAARHDFERWLPKLSARGVVLLHDIAERQSDFGVWQLWEELAARYPSHLALEHGHGLGIVAVGEQLPEAARALLELPEPARAAWSALMAELGRRIEDREAATFLRGEQARLDARLAALAQESDQRLQAASADLARAIATYERRIVDVQGEVAAERSRAANERAVLRHQYQTQLDDAHNRIAELETQLKNAQWRINWFETSRGVRVIKLARASRALLEHKGPGALAKQVTLWLLGRRGYSLSDITLPLPPAPTFAVAPPTLGRKAVMFISGVPDSAMRYRCAHQAEALGFMGYTTDLSVYGRVDLDTLVDHYEAFVLHRVPFEADVERFINAARSRGKHIFFETDDWVFEPEAAPYIARLTDVDDHDRNIFLETMRRYQQTLMASDGVIVSTEPLRQLALKYHNNVVTAPNAVSAAMAQGADAALRWSAERSFKPRDTVTIGYFSGTPTHNRDFLEASDAVLWALERYPEVIFKVVGELALDERFERFGSRVVRIGFQRWEDLPRVYSTVDISIAPLEPNNPFTDSKSSIKYLEAALCEVPTVASPRAEFRRTIVPGENGLLAETPEEWRAALAQLIEFPALRQEMGQRASAQVRAHETTRQRSTALHQAFLELAAHAEQRLGAQPLTINWILHAPIAERGNGYRAIFRLANYLGSQGHKVRVYVDPVAHLEYMTPEEVRAYIERHFGPLNGELVVGHDHIAPADASIATFWTTAYTVERRQDSLFKFYFIQDFEPEFYDPADPRYVEAERTYDLPLQHICIGDHLGQRIGEITGKKPDVIDYAVDHTVFQMRRAPADRRGHPRVLFFARPGLKRRGYELGIEALRKIKQQRPDTEILLFGSTDQELGPLPFEATNLGILDHAELAEALNSVHILLTFSLSNISWAPFEGMACGAAVIEVDVPSVRAMVPADEGCLLAEPNAEAVASQALRLIEDDDLRRRIATAGVQFMTQRDWENTARQFEALLLRHCWLRERVDDQPQKQASEQPAEAALEPVPSKRA